MMTIASPSRFSCRSIKMAASAVFILLLFGCVGTKEAKVVAYDIQLYEQDTLPSLEKLKNNNKTIVANYNTIADTANKTISQQFAQMGQLYCERQLERSRSSLYEQKAALLETLQGAATTSVNGLEEKAKAKLKPLQDRIDALDAERQEIGDSRAALALARKDEVTKDLLQLSLIVNSAFVEALLLGTDATEEELKKALAAIKQKTVAENNALAAANTRCKAEAQQAATDFEALFITDLKGDDAAFDALSDNTKALSESGKQLLRQQTFNSLDENGALRSFGRTVATSAFHSTLGIRSQTASAEEAVEDAQDVSTDNLRDAFNAARDQLLADLADNIPFINLARAVGADDLEEAIETAGEDAIEAMPAPAAPVQP